MAKKTNWFEDALAAEGVSGKLADLARSVFKQESGSGTNSKTSNAGAVGGMQIVPATFNRMADKGWDINDPMQNARAGIRYLQHLDKKAGGDPALTAVGYYGGEGAIPKARQGIAVSDPRNPNAPNTLEYGREVAARLGSGPVMAPPRARSGVVPVPAQVVPVVPEGVVAPPVAVEAAPVTPVAVQEGPMVPSAWADFQQATARQMQPSDLDFQQVLSSRAPAPLYSGGVPAPSLVPNFQAFKSWRGRV